jgi:GNAT superfamily N-acetyltransferase
MTQATTLEITRAIPADVPLLLSLIKELAEFEKLQQHVVATEAVLSQSLFGGRPAAEAVIARVGGKPAGFALYFHNFSTFLGRHGLYLEDLFVRPDFRSRAVGKSLLAYLAKLAVERGCGRFEWAVLDWNRRAQEFYESLGAQARTDWIGYRISGDALRRLSEAGIELT